MQTSATSQATEAGENVLNSTCGIEPCTSQNEAIGICYCHDWERVASPSADLQTWFGRDIASVSEFAVNPAWKRPVALASGPQMLEAESRSIAALMPTAVGMIALPLQPVGCSTAME